LLNAAGGREDEAHEHANDGYDHKEFYHRETVPLRAVSDDTGGLPLLRDKLSLEPPGKEKHAAAPLHPATRDRYEHQA
jgi:hypothetical protein